MIHADAPAHLRDQDLTPLFILADAHANRAQRRFLAWVRWHILVLLGASLAQLLASLHAELAAWLHIPTPGALVGLNWERLWYCVLALFVGGILLTRLWLRRRPDNPWLHYRALAEQAKHLSWLYSLGLSDKGDWSAEASTDERFEQALGELRSQWNALNPAQVLPAIPSAITPAMRQLRGQSMATRLQVYAAERLQDQIAWYRRKADWNRHRARTFEWAQYTAEGVALLGAIFLALQFAGFGKWTGLMYPGLSLAAAILAWTGHKRYHETANSYSQTADCLESLAKELNALQSQAEINADDFAQGIKACEGILLQENALWLTRRS